MFRNTNDAILSKLLKTGHITKLPPDVLEQQSTNSKHKMVSGCSKIRKVIGRSSYLRTRLQVATCCDGREDHSEICDVLQSIC